MGSNNSTESDTETEIEMETIVDLEAFKLVKTIDRKYIIIVEGKQYKRISFVNDTNYSFGLVAEVSMLNNTFVGVKIQFQELNVINIEVTLIHRTTDYKVILKDDEEFEDYLEEMHKFVEHQHNLLNN